MDGITDNAFRSIAKQNGADVVYSEFISVDGIYHASQKMKQKMSFTEQQRPYVVQIFGKKPEMFANAAKIVENFGADGVDINIGCPSKAVVKHGSGVKLMLNLDLIYNIIESTIASVKKIPVSIKIRSGIEDVTAEEMLTRIKDLPFAAVMMHGRTYEQCLSGPIDTEQIKRAKEIVGNKIVLANGGITSPEIAKDILEKTQVDGLGIGRGVLGSPWLIQQIKDYFKTEKYTQPSWDEVKEIICEHARLLYKNKNDKGIIEFRKHLCWYIKSFPNASEFRKQLVMVEKIDEIQTLLARILP